MQKPVYHYISSPDYVDQLKFDHVETYSFQRGKEYQDRADEFTYLKNLKLTQDALTSEQKIRYEDLLNYPRPSEFLIDENGQFSSSSVCTGRFDKGASEIETILSILKTATVDVPAWMCWPIYRDAIVFYDANSKPTSVLNICFSCEYMATKAFHWINADIEVYRGLRQLFLEIGHPIEPK